MKKFMLLILASLMPLIMINSQSLDDYRSKQSGNWNSTASWERYDGTNWIDATASPTSVNGVITVRNAHTISITENITYDQVIVEQGGQVTVASGITTTLNNGTGMDLVVNGTWLNQGGTWTTTGTAWIVSSTGTFIHNTASGISTPLNSATLDTTSTFIYLGSSSLRPAISVSGRTYGNLRFESTSGNWPVDASVSGTNTLTVLGNFYVGSGVNYNTSQTGLMSFDGDFIIDGTLTNNTGTQSYNFTGTNKLIGGSTPTLSFENVTIGSSASYQLERNISILSGFTLTVNGGLICNSANILGDGNFTLAPGGNLGIGSPDGITSSGSSGNVQVIGTRSFSAGANFIYNGTSPQVTGNGLPGPTVANPLTGSLNINNPMGVTLSEGRTISGVFVLTSGNLITSNTNLLRIGSNGTITGGSASSFVDGPLAKIIQTTSIFTFQIGKGSTYRTIGITPTSTSLTQFNAEYFDNPYSDILTFGEGIAKVSVIDYFILNRVSGSANASVTLSWGSNSGVSNLNDLRVARWSDAEWIDEGNTEITGEVTSGTIKSNVITSFSPFALGSSTIQSLPVELSSFSAIVLENSVKLNWRTETEVSNYGFEVERLLKLISNIRKIQEWRKDWVCGGTW
jgi:hypothetical protein